MLGAFVADAATMPLHWIYDTAALAAKVDGGEPAFFEPPSCPFYNYEPGRLSPYGDEALALLESVVKRGGIEACALCIFAPRKAPVIILRKDLSSIPRTAPERIFSLLSLSSTPRRGCLRWPPARFPTLCAVCSVVVDKICLKLRHFLPLASAGKRRSCSAPLASL